MVLVMGDQLLLRARLHREQAGGVLGSMGVCTDEVVTVGAGGYSGLDWEVGAPLQAVPVTFPALGVGAAWNRMAVWALPLIVLVTTGLWKSLFPS